MPEAPSPHDARIDRGADATLRAEIDEKACSRHEYLLTYTFIARGTTLGES
jgi:hypothetical protein